jgi:hypothetical protein
LLEMAIVKGFGQALFVTSSIVAAVMWFIFASGLISRRYKNMEERDWKDQVW